MFLRLWILPLYSKQEVCVLSHFSHVRLFATLWTAVHQVPLSMDPPGKNTGVGYHALLQGSSGPRDQTQISQVSCIGRQVLFHECHLESPKQEVYLLLSLVVTLWCTSFHCDHTVAIQKHHIPERSLQPCKVMSLQVPSTRTWPL